MGTREQETNRQETIAKLYSLRAGLSFLSEIRDEAEKYEKSMENNEYKIKQCINEHRKLHDSIKYRYSQTVKPVKNEIKILEEAIQEYEANLKKREKKFLFLAIVSLLFLSISVGAVILSYLDISAINGDNHIPSMLSIAGALISLTLFFLCLSAYMNIGQKALRSETHIVNTKRYTVHYNMDPRFSIEERKQELEQKINAYEEYKNECERKIVEIQNEIGDMQAEIKAASESLPSVIAYFKAVYRALLEQFGMFIDERDWGNTDLIIFNYESGRALDLRDALLQIDDERRHERLEKAVQYASTTICSGIERGLGTAEDAFEENIAVLESKIAYLASQISADTSQKTNLLAENINARKAMLSKKSKSSCLLAEDVQYMRKLAESAANLG